MYNEATMVFRVSATPNIETDLGAFEYKIIEASDTSTAALEGFFLTQQQAAASASTTGDPLAKASAKKSKASSYVV